MDTQEFKTLLTTLQQLTQTQRRKLAAALARSQQGDAVSVIEQCLGQPTQCPHCAADHPVRFGRANGLQRYRCHACRRTFNALTGTPMARLRQRDKWLGYAEALRDGLSVRKAAAQCEVHRTTAFRWRHRFLSNPKDRMAAHLTGIVEADETFLRASRKGDRQVKLTRKPRKRGGSAKKRGLSGEQVCVLIARDRGGATLDAVLPNMTDAALQQVLAPIVDRDAVLCSDGRPAYAHYAAATDTAHKPVNLSAGIRVVDKVFHIQHVNAYHSRFKGWMARFHGVASKYLPNYLGWRRLLESAPGACPSPRTVMDWALGI
ncbi:IS1595 family transposase [Chitinivorax sp. PXF-14]|uniref:IS1595 family transposase n=1 Tax=Chitinivorax sp. PXF-14 TaxID=3230488 RepID=UPI0034661A2B